VSSEIQTSPQDVDGRDDGPDERGTVNGPAFEVPANPSEGLTRPASSNGHHRSPDPKPRPRVLHVLEAVGGGTLHHLLDVLQTVTTVEHHVVVPPDHAAPGDEPSINALGSQEMLDFGAVLHRVEMLRNPLHPRNAASIVKLRRLVSELKPLLVHGHSSVGGAFARASVWGTAVPSIYTPHGVTANRAVLAVERVLAHRTTRFVAVSASEGERALSLGLTSRERMVVVPNGIDLEPAEPSRFDLRKFLQLHADVPLVGTVSRLVSQKSPEDFVRICAEVYHAQSDVHFVLIGAGQLQPEVDAAVNGAGIADRFHQIPFLPKASLAIQQLNVFVLASLFEGAAYTPLEAMKAGVPVVLSAVTGNTDTVDHNVSGFLFPFGDTAAMASGVLTLLSDTEIRQSLVDAATERLRDRFDRQDMGAGLERLYGEFDLQNV
jgi:glycosyltransferase involved in cell wall biosynthesis